MMRTIPFGASGFLSFAALALGACAATSVDTIAILDVTVIPVTDEPPIAGATVLVRGERIEAVGPAAEIDVPRGAREVNGEGKYLIPGLIEMHAHLSKARASGLGLSRFLLLDWREQVLELPDEDTRGLLTQIFDSEIRDLREMHEAGVDLLVGSDVAVLNIYPGSSLHEEMALFVERLGMTPAEVLERTTRKSAAFLGIADSVGTIAPGQIADLVLLDANPLEDIRNVGRVTSVIVRGTVYDPTGLDEILAAVDTAHDQTVNDWLPSRRRRCRGSPIRKSSSRSRACFESTTHRPSGTPGPSGCSACAAACPSTWVRNHSTLRRPASMSRRGSSMPWGCLG